jgi:hypothetical protein
MAQRKITQLEYTMIDERVHNVLQRISSHKKGYAFLYMVLETLFSRFEDDIQSLITEGGNDRGADAVHIHSHENCIYVNIIQCKYADNIKNSGKNFPGGEIDKLISLISDILNRSTGLIKSVNPILAKKIEDIWRFVDDGFQIYIKIYFISNTESLQTLESDRVRSFCQQYKMVDFEQITFSEIINLLYSGSEPKESGSLRCVDLQKFERIDGDIRGLIANIDAYSFIRLITDNENKNIKRHLFEENIRGYLGFDGGYNRQIQRSALDDENHLFWYLNNGITIIAKDFTHQPMRGSSIMLDKFQIVNGAQTSYSLFNAYNIDPERISKIVLLIKIFASNRDDIGDKIAIATNSQARILPRDLKANDPIQKKIAAILKENYILYERKKNEFDPDSSNVRIDSLKLGQALVAFNLEDPHHAKTMSDEIFGNHYSRVSTDNLSAKYILNIVKLFLFISKYREEQLSNIRLTATGNEELDFIGYAQWHILYCIKLLAKRNGILIPDESEFKGYLDRSLEIISKIAKNNKSQSYYRMFRSATMKEIIQREIGIGQLNFEFL